MPLFLVDLQAKRGILLLEAVIPEGTAVFGQSPRILTFKDYFFYNFLSKAINKICSVKFMIKRIKF